MSNQDTIENKTKDAQEEEADIEVVLVSEDEKQYPDKIKEKYPRAYEVFCERVLSGTVESGKCLLIFADKDKKKVIGHLICVNSETGEIDMSAYNEGICDLFLNKWTRNNKKSVEIPVKHSYELTYCAFIHWEYYEYPGHVTICDG